MHVPLIYLDGLFGSGVVSHMGTMRGMVKYQMILLKMLPCGPPHTMSSYSPLLFSTFNFFSKLLMFYQKIHIFFYRLILELTKITSNLGGQT